MNRHLAPAGINLQIKPDRAPRASSPALEVLLADLFITPFIGLATAFLSLGVKVFDVREKVEQKLERKPSGLLTETLSDKEAVRNVQDIYSTFERVQPIALEIVRRRLRAIILSRSVAIVAVFGALWFLLSFFGRLVDIRLWQAVLIVIAVGMGLGASVTKFSAADSNLLGRYSAVLRSRWELASTSLSALAKELEEVFRDNERRVGPLATDFPSAVFALARLIESLERQELSRRIGQSFGYLHDYMRERAFAICVGAIEQLWRQKSLGPEKQANRRVIEGAWRDEGMAQYIGATSPEFFDTDFATMFETPTGRAEIELLLSKSNPSFDGLRRDPMESSKPSRRGLISLGSFSALGQD